MEKWNHKKSPPSNGLKSFTPQLGNPCDQDTGVWFTVKLQVTKVPEGITSHLNCVDQSSRVTHKWQAPGSSDLGSESTGRSHPAPGAPRSQVPVGGRKRPGQLCCVFFPYWKREFKPKKRFLTWFCNPLAPGYLWFCPKLMESFQVHAWECEFDSEPVGNCYSPL